MIRSMTGFGRAKNESGGLAVTVEIRSVNHRYFEFSSRLPRAYAFLEEKLKTLCSQHIARGKVEVAVQVEEIGSGGTVIEWNRSYADAYLAALQELAKTYHIKNDVKVSTLAQQPDLFTVRHQTATDETVLAAVLPAAQEAIGVFLSMREAEGERLAEDVRSRLQVILEKVAFVEERSPETAAQYRERLEQKLRELLGDTAVDEQRLLTETAVFADKIAVAEETVRLRSHIRQMEKLLSAEEPVGRKLDFLVQEMNREANTIGSKAQDIQIAHTVVDMKSEIEKIREQIQNIE